MNIDREIHNNTFTFLALKCFLTEYYKVYGTADNSIESLLSNLGRIDRENSMPLDPALWDMWQESLAKAHILISK